MSWWVLEEEWKKYSEVGTCIVLVIGDVTHSYSSSKTWYPSTLGLDSLQWECIVVANCACMAGLAMTCPHVGAILHVRVQMNFSCISKDNVGLYHHPDKVFIFETP